MAIITNEVQGFGCQVVVLYWLGISAYKMFLNNI